MLPPNSEYYCLVDASWNLFDELNQFKTEQTFSITSVSQRLPLCYMISLRSS
ncbi:unnamed protein product [Brassica oleracea]